MREVIKRIREQRGGFTLVEIIVVLVVLSLAGAILVPTVTGFVAEANQERNCQTAQTVRVAAQAVADDQAAFGNLDDIYITKSDTTKSGTTVEELSGTTFDSCTFELDKKGKITTGSVMIEGTVYYLNDDGEWSVAESRI